MSCSDGFVASAGNDARTFISEGKADPLGATRLFTPDPSPVLGRPNRLQGHSDRWPRCGWVFSSEFRSARRPIDEQLYTGDEAGIARRKEEGDRRDLFGSPIFPRGTRALKLSIASCGTPAKILVLIVPGLSVLTRMLRALRSTVHVRANERTAALLAP